MNHGGRRSTITGGVGGGIRAPPTGRPEGRLLRGGLGGGCPPREKVYILFCLPELLSIRSKPFAVRVFAEELTWDFFRTFRSSHARGELI